MVGPALQIGLEGTLERQDEQHGDKHRHLTYPRATSQQRQPVKHQSADAGKKGSENAGKAVDQSVGTEVSERCGIALASPSGRLSHSNLDRFLEVTTPTVHPHYLPKTCLRDAAQKRWLPCEAESTPYFFLGDLWASFDEWSAYGAGVPIVLNGNESVVQYYVPYLSALQLYTRSERSPYVHFRRCGEESDASDGEFRDTSSENSSDGENERPLGHGRTFRCRGLKGTDNSSLCSSLGSNSRLDCLVTGSADQRGEFIIDDDESSQEGEMDHLFYQYFEGAPPYSRVPLTDKIADLARDNPELLSLRSLDLLPSSWMSVAWYPIYRIPTGPTLRDLAACFLTFHHLSTPLQGASDGSTGASLRQFANGSEACEIPAMCVRNSEKLMLRAFGLASYKLRGAIWTSNSERRYATSLQNSADVWLKQLHVQHPDFDFFLSHNTSTRR